MKPEEYTEVIVEVDGWPVRLTSYKLDGTYHCKADNVSPGANLARIAAGTKEEAESKALGRARELLGRTRRHAI